MALDIQPTDLEKAWNWFQAQPRGWQAIIIAGTVFVLSTIAALFSWRFFFRSRLKAKDVALTALAKSKDHIIEEKTATIERLDSHLKLMEAEELLFATKNSRLLTRLLNFAMLMISIAFTTT
jgi:hypothetical protein